MRWGKLISSVVLVLLIASLSILAPGCVDEEEASHASGGTWYTSYDEALNLSAESGKPVMIYFWADWCMYCNKYSAETLSDLAVVEILGEYFVLLAIDVDTDQEGTASIYGVRSMPATVFVDSDGAVLEVVRSHVPPSIFIPVLQKVRAMET